MRADYISLSALGGVMASRGALRHFQHAYQIALMTKINLIEYAAGQLF
jgi:hypothetical protein